MSAQDNLSQELFYNVYRGIASTPEGINQRNRVGMHWSADKEVATDFAVDNAYSPDNKKPILFHSQVPVSSVETDNRTLFRNKVGGKFAEEKEVPVGQGKKLLITGRTTFRQDKNIAPEEVKKNRNRYSKTRTRTYNPPREATA